MEWIMKLKFFGYVGLIILGILMTISGFPISYFELYISFSLKSYWLSFLFI